MEIANRVIFDAATSLVLGFHSRGDVCDGMGCLSRKVVPFKFKGEQKGGFSRVGFVDRIDYHACRR